MVRRRARAAAAGLGHPVRRVLRAGRQHGRPAAVPRRRRRARGPADRSGAGRRTTAVLEVRARMELSPRSMAVGVDGRARGRAGALRGDLRLRGLRRRPRDRGRPADRGGGHGRAPVPRPGAHRRVRRRAAGDRRHRFHVYAADWRPGRVDFLVDGEHVKTVHQAPGLPDADDGRRVRLPAKAAAAPPDHVPQLAVDWVRGGAQASLEDVVPVRMRLGGWCRAPSASPREGERRRLRLNHPALWSAGVPGGGGGLVGRLVRRARPGRARSDAAASAQ